MPDNHESAVDAWLRSPSTLREIKIIKQHFPKWTEYEHYSFVLQIETLVALEVYADNEVAEGPLDPPDDDEPWRPRAA